MSVEDGLVMQIHPGSVRNHNAQLYARYGRDMGADIPGPTDYVNALKPLLDRFGNEPNLVDHFVHTGRNDVQQGIGPAGRSLSVPASWAAMVVLRQPGGNAPVSRTGNGDGGLL